MKLITKEQFYQEHCEWCELSCPSDGYCAELESLYNSLPDAPYWISVSDGLPDDNDDYMVTVYNSTCSARYVGVAEWDVDRRQWVEYDNEQIIAWMPLIHAYTSAVDWSSTVAPREGLLTMPTSPIRYRPIWQ